MPQKRKRPEPAPPEGGRPSPHRPGDTSLAQHDRDAGSRGRGRGGGHRNNSFHRRDSSASQSGRNQTQPSPSPSRRESNAHSGGPPTTPATTPAPPKSFTTPTTTTMQPPTPASTNPAPSDRRYEHLTDEKLKSWTDGSRNQIVSHGCQSRDDQDTAELSVLFQEFIYSVMEGRMPPTEAGRCVREMLGEANPSKEPVFSPHNLLLDLLQLILDVGAGGFVPTLGVFLEETGISVDLARRVLDANVLSQLGLVRNQFDRTGVKHATNYLYRQANYNLLREESEGYAKLITELHMTSDNFSTDVPKETFERIKALVGTFDIDVGRTLDVTLDVFAVMLVKQFKFFVRLLRDSSWWPKGGLVQGNDSFVGGLPTWATPGYPAWFTTDEDEAENSAKRLLRDVSFWTRAREVRTEAFFEIGGRRISHSDCDAWQSKDGDDAVVAARKAWVEITKTLPPHGNYVAANLLGFKLLFYYSPNRDPTDVLPANLLYLAALLIKIGFVSFPDLYPHLSPPDEGMEKVREAKMKELEEAERKTRGGSMNALLMAGALTNDEDENPHAPPRRLPAGKNEPDKAQTTKKEPEEAKKDEPHEQKVSLLIQLLTIGALPEATFILGRFPWIPEAYPDVLDGIHRILHVCVSKVFDESKPKLSTSATCPVKNMPDYDQTGVPKGSVKVSPMTIKKTLKWPTPDKNDHGDNQDYHYYWDEWTDNIPVCQTVDDIFTLCESFLNFSGVNIGKDAALLSKLATIGAKSLHVDPSESNKTRWRELLKRLLLPALSHTHANASVVDAIWTLLKRFDTTTRYALYAEWFEGQTSRLPSMKTAFERARAETRATMKRVSLTNLSEMAKRLAKTSYSSPGVVFTVAFGQLESYPNLIEAFVECAKYFTDLSYDVLIWSLLSSLGKPRSRTQAEHALTTSKWLSALSRFVGKVYRRYSNLTPVPVLSYVDEQLSLGNSTDLVILKEFLSSMGGIVDASDFSYDQILGMAGGDYLRKQTLVKSGDLRYDNARSSKRLIQALTETDLASQILTNLAQFRQARPFQIDEDEAHIKYLSTIVDDSHKILYQYVDFLWSNVDPATFDKLVPSILDLMKTFGLDASLAFHIGRSSLSHRMFPWKSKETQGKEDAAKDQDGDAKMVEAGSAKETGQETTATEAQKTDEPSLDGAVLTPIAESIKDILPADVWEKITPDLFVTFWALQLGDLYCPDHIYRQEAKHVEQTEKALAQDRTDMTNRRVMDRRLAKRKELMNFQIGLHEERQEHALRQGRWKFYLSKHFQSAFPDPKPSPEAIADELLESCFLPRVVVSPADAEYTYRFIRMMHECNAPGFKLMTLYDRLFNANRLRALIFATSVREAENVGRFLSLILENLSLWHKNAPLPTEKASKDHPKLGVYEREAKGPAEQPKLGFALTVDENGKPSTFVEHAQFQDMLFKWHRNLNTALKSCLGGMEWMHIRNALTVLNRVIDFFPAIDFQAKQFMKQLETIHEREGASSKSSGDGEAAHRVDLSVAAQGTLSELMRRKPKWMMVQAFRPNSVGGGQKSDDKGSLNAAAAEFKPTSADTRRNGGGNDAEDGEVADAAKTRGADGSTQPSKSNADSLPSKPSPAHGRDTPKRDVASSNTSRASTSRNDNNRPGNLPNRPIHHLPTRPDVPIPAHPSSSDRFAHTPARPGDRRDPRETREPRDARSGREGHDARSSPREGLPARDPRSDSRGPRDVRDTREHRHDPRDNWRQEKDWAEHNMSQPPDRRGLDPRESHHGPRSVPGQERDRPLREGRGGGRVSELPPERPPSAHQLPTPQNPDLPINPERAALLRHDAPGSSPGSRGVGDAEKPSRGRRPGPAETPEHINPDRAALLGGPAADASGTPSRPGREDVRDRGGRTHSPYDGRPPARGGRERSPGPRDRPFPSGPDTMRQNFDPRAHEDSNYGRLNPVQSTPDIPSGPRSRGRGARGGHLGPQGHGHAPPLPSNAPGADQRYGGHSSSVALPPRPHSQQDSTQQALERQPPTGPASGRTHSHGPGGHGGGRRNDGPPPAGPPNQPPMGPGGGHSHHNDRSRNMNDAPSGGGVHPERLAQLGNSGRGAPASPSAGPGPTPQGPTADAPDRPRSDPRANAHAAAAAAAADNSSRDRPPNNNNARQGTRQLAGINNVLQANSPSVSGGVGGGNAGSGPRRGHPRTMLANSDVQVLTGGSPVTTPGHERTDPMMGSKPSNGGFEEGSNSASHDSRGRRDNRDRDRSDRSYRSRRSSRDRERERSPARDKEHKDHREYREREGRRSGAGGGSESRDSSSRRQNGASGGGSSSSLPKDGMLPPSSSSGSGRYRNDDGSRSSRGGDDRRRRRTDDGSGLPPPPPPPQLPPPPPQGPPGDHGREKRQRR